MATVTQSTPGQGIENQPPDVPFRMNLNNRVICPDCQETPPNLVEEGAELICASCGIVLKDRMISYESEWRTFNSDDSRGEDPNRVGEADNDLLTGSNIGTQIGGGFGSGASRRLQMTQSKLQGNKLDGRLQDAYSRLDSWANELRISSGPANLAKKYYYKVADVPTFRGKNVDGVLAGCLFIACRQLKVPRSFAEMFGQTSVPKKEIGRMYKQLEKFLLNEAKSTDEALESQGLVVGDSQFVNTQTLRPQDIVERICSQIGVRTRTTIVYALHLARKVVEIKDLAGRSPLSTAAACIYMAGHLVGQPKSYKEISKYANVSDATIKQAYKKLWENRDTVIESTWTKSDSVTPVNPDDLPSS